MIGALTAGKKAATYGYKKYGVPGAVVAGAGGAAGVVVAKKGIKRVVRSDVGDAEPHSSDSSTAAAAGGSDEGIADTDGDQSGVSEPS